MKIANPTQPVSDTVNHDRAARVHTLILGHFNIMDIRISNMQGEMERAVWLMIIYQIFSFWRFAVALTFLVPKDYRTQSDMIRFYFFSIPK